MEEIEKITLKEPLNHGPGLFQYLVIQVLAKKAIGTKSLGINVVFRQIVKKVYKKLKAWLLLTNRLLSQKY